MIKTSYKKLFHYKLPVFIRFTIGLIILVLLFSPRQSCCEWIVGGGVNSYPAVGNLNLTELAVEYEVFVSHENSFGAIYIYALSRLSPGIKENHEFKKLSLNTCWMLRSARIKIWKLQTCLTAGFGFTLVEMENTTNRKVLQGSGTLRTDVDLVVMEKSGVTLLTGISYRGSPIHNTELYSDRFGFKVSIAW